MKHHYSICPHCGCGCGLYIVEQDGLISGTTASQGHYFGHGQLCARGWTSHQLLRSDKRLQPQVGEPGKASKVDWPTALKSSAELLGRIKKNFGPQSIGLVGSARLTSEDAWALRSLAEDVLGTPHFDSSARLEWIPRTMPQPGKYRDLDQADLIIVFGADLLEDNPILGARIVSRAKPKEERPYVSPDIYHQIPTPPAELYYIGSRPGDLNRVARDRLKIYPGAEWRFAFALLKVLAEAHQSRVDPQGLSGIRKTLQDLSLSGLVNGSGAEVSQIEMLAARILEAKHPLLVFGRSLCQARNSGAAFSALADIALFLDGKLRVLQAPCAANDWGTASILCTGSGLSYLEMIAAVEEGRLKCLVLVGEDPLRSLPGSDRVRKALAKAEALIVVDAFSDNLCLSQARACLPLKLSLENSGTLSNAEGQAQEITPAVQSDKARSFREIAGAWAEILGGRIKTEGRQKTSEMEKFLPLAVPQKPAAEGMILELGTAYPHLYGDDLLTFNSPHLVREFAGAYVELHPDDIASLSLRSGWRAGIVSEAGRLEALVISNPMLLKGTAYMPVHFGGNLLAPLAYDEMLKTPILRAIPIKVEKP